MKVQALFLLLLLLFLIPYWTQAQNKVGINTTSPLGDLDVRGTDNVWDGGELQLSTPGMTNFIRMFGGRLGDPNPFLAFSDSDTFRIVTTSSDWSTFSRRWTFTPDGKLGIGTETPLSRLDIRALGDGAELLRFTTDRPWVIKQTGTGISTALTFQPTTNDKALQILSESGANMAARFFTNNTYSKVSLVPDGGEVGIGIPEATGKLHVRGNSTTTDPQFRLTETSATDFARIKMENENEPGIFWDIAALADSSASLSKINFYYANPGFSGDKMTITGEGNVGIGTTNPGNRLRVNGSSSSSQHVFSASSNYSGDVQIRAIEGFATPGVGYGIGGYFIGGSRGLQVFGQGGASTGLTIAVEGTANGTAGTRTGLFGRATGGTTNWAGYFAEGNVKIDNHLYIDDNVGIGTTSPAEKLHVVGNMRVTGLAGSGDRNVIVDSDGKLKPSTLGSGGGGWIETPDYVYNNTHNIGIGTSTPSSRLHIIQGGSGSAQSIVFPGTPPFFTDSKVMTMDAGNLNVTGNINSTLALQGVSDGPVTMVMGGGNVGIGQIASTNKKLSIQGPPLINATQQATLSLLSEITVGNFSEMLMDGRSIRTVDDDLRLNFDSPHNIIIGSNMVGSNLVGIGTGAPTSKLTVRGPENTGSNGILRLNKENSSFFMVLDNNELDVVGETFFINGNSSENVAIGTFDPAVGYKLSVGGKIIAEEVRVQLQTAWPDYVFKENYELMPLQEVKANIDQLGHLPGIPSAGEVENEGVLLGDMQRLMMEKIEELTLHLIDMDERMKKLEAENVALRTALSDKS